MKNFILALLVFLVWGGIGIFYLHESGSLQNQAEATRAQDLNLWENIPDDLNFNTDSSIYPDNSLLFNEMSTTVRSIKKQYGIETIEKSDVENTKNTKHVHLLFPEFRQGQLVIDQHSINYGKILEKAVIADPDVKITVIGHFNDKDGSLDNYFEGLQRAKHLKQYIIENFKIPESYISAISEGESRKMIDVDKNLNSTKNNRIEISIED